MLIIPVIDLCAGQVVHAVAGKRDAYKNIQSPLCHGSDPVAVVEALLGLYSFTVLYIADLDAINRQGNHNSVIDQIMTRYPGLSVWLDAGHASPPSRHAVPLLRHVIGTETGVSSGALLSAQADASWVLSLDFSEQGLIGDQELLNEYQTWPEDIIVMSLNRVGTSAGPDFDRLELVQTRAPGKRIYAAGGVRNDRDLEALHTQHVSGVLLASALHYGTVSRQCLEQYSAN